MNGNDVDRVMFDCIRALNAAGEAERADKLSDVFVAVRQERDHLRAELEAKDAELTEARRLIDEARKQEPEVFVCHKPGTGYQTVVRSQTMAQQYRKEGYSVVGYYAAPVPAQPAVPDDVAKDAARYRFLRECVSNTDSTQSLVLDELMGQIDELEGRAYSDALDTAIDAAMLAATDTEVKK